jgi:hypothetical protein
MESFHKWIKQTYNLDYKTEKCYSHNGHPEYVIVYRYKNLGFAEFSCGEVEDFLACALLLQQTFPSPVSHLIIHYLLCLPSKLFYNCKVQFKHQDFKWEYWKHFLNLYWVFESQDLGYTMHVADEKLCDDLDVVWYRNFVPTKGTRRILLSKDWIHECLSGTLLRIEMLPFATLGKHRPSREAIQLNDDGYDEDAHNYYTLKETRVWRYEKQDLL